MQLNDEVAEEVMREAARNMLERFLDTALEAVKRRTRVRDYSPAIQVTAGTHCDSMQTFTHDICPVSSSVCDMPVGTTTGRLNKLLSIAVSSHLKSCSDLST